MKNLLFAILLFCSVTIYGQENQTHFDGHKWEAPYELPVPKNWTIERFLVPPSFAPEILYKGVEDIRFTPGWAKINSEEYWSYTFLWCLDTKPDIDEIILEKDLSLYYTGLLKANTDTSKLKLEKYIPVKVQVQKAKPLSGELKFYTGSIEMRDYMTRKEIKLNCKIHFISCQEIGKTILFFELSPQPFKHNVWSTLDQLWFDFKCKKG